MLDANKIAKALDWPLKDGLLSYSFDEVGTVFYTNADVTVFIFMKNDYIEIERELEKLR